MAKRFAALSIPLLDPPLVLSVCLSVCLPLCMSVYNVIHTLLTLSHRSLGSFCSTNSSWEHHIREDLLDNYDKKVRPVRRGKWVMEVSFTMRIGRLVKVVRV